MKGTLAIFAIGVLTGAMYAQASLELKAPAIFEQLEQRKATNRSINAEGLAEVANGFAREQGFPFGFDPANFRERVRTVRGKRTAYYDLVGVNGRRLRFAAPERGDHPCGTHTEFPVRRLSGSTFDLVSGGKTYPTRIPKQFVTDQIELVDATLKRSLAKWLVPMDSTPVGISRDARRIYLSTEMDQLLLEIDASGNLRYVAARSPQIIRDGVDLKRFPKDKKNDYLGFRRFRSGRTTHFVKFSHPCT